MSRTAFLARDGEHFVPLEPARGYWSRDSLHGRTVVGVLGHVLQARHGDDGFLPARLTVDMHRLPRFARFTVESCVVRDGGRLRLVEAILMADGVEYARSTAQFLRTGQGPDKPRWAGEPWDAPHPDDLPSSPISGRLDGGAPLFDWKIVAGKMGSPPPRQCWLREARPLIEGEPLSAWDRLVSGVDFASPWTHGVPFDPGYINTDVTLQIHRLPVGEWIGYEATGHQASQGVAVGQCRLHDLSGPIGFAATTALHQSRRG